MANRSVQRKWGNRFGLSVGTVDLIYSLINSPIKHHDYLLFSAQVTKWWDDDESDYVPSHIKKNCKTAVDREKAERSYLQYLSEELKIFKGIFFSARETGRDLSRVKGIGYFQSYLQRKYIRPKGREFLCAFYLHHLLDYCGGVREFPLTETIRINRDRVAANDSEYEEISDFVRRNWPEIEKDLQEN